MTVQALPKIRRVVTGHQDSVATVMIDAPASNEKHPLPGATATLMWCTDATPADIAIGRSFEDMGARILGTPPPPNGTRFTINDFPPGCKALMHRTETLDYAIVLQGRIDMDMDDDQTVTLQTGDVLIQRGTNHAWVNRSDAMARVAFILIDAKPLGIGHAVHGTANVEQR